MIIQLFVALHLLQLRRCFEILQQMEQYQNLADCSRLLVDDIRIILL